GIGLALAIQQIPEFVGVLRLESRLQSRYRFPHLGLFARTRGVGRLRAAARTCRPAQDDPPGPTQSAVHGPSSPALVAETARTPATTLCPRSCCNKRRRGWMFSL